MKITPTLERANSVTVDTRQIDAATSGSARAHCTSGAQSNSAQAELVAPHIARVRPINCVRRREDNNEAV